VTDFPTVIIYKISRQDIRTFLLRNKKAIIKSKKVEIKIGESRLFNIFFKIEAIYKVKK